MNLPILAKVLCFPFIKSKDFRTGGDGGSWFAVRLMPYKSRFKFRQYFEFHSQVWDTMIKAVIDCFKQGRTLYAYTHIGTP